MDSNNKSLTFKGSTYISFWVSVQSKNYPISLPQLGYLSFEIPETRSDLEALGSTLETIGFKVKSYKDFNVQVMNINRSPVASVLILNKPM